MQGCRQLFPTFGETFVVTGMGLLGQIAAQILRAAGCHVICSDPIESKRILATQLGADAACSPGELHAVTDEWTGGYGADGVLICAASKGSEVANQALEICRQKGRVSIVGAVGMDLARDAMYMKELDLRLSCSYGPGRYQPNYEEKGLDYPIGYVRWTEGRNMSEFLRMIADKKVQVKPLISLRKPVDEAQAAYGAVLDKDSGTIAALLLYGAEETAPRPPIERKIPVRPKLPKADAVKIAVIGAGAIANAFHLPSITRIPDAQLVAVVDQVGSKAKQAATRFGAEYCTGDYKDVIADSNVDAVLIATRHNLHKPIAIAAAQAGKHVFVEKPMALTAPDCEEVCEAVEKAGILLTVGFNRRFSKFSVAAKKALRSVHGPKMILYRCNAGALPHGHWANDPEEGGGRIVGEAVHFFDLCCWFLDQDPVEIRANAVAGHTESTVAQDNLAASLRFPDGSLATVIYCTVGDSAAGKEYIEIHGSGKTIVIDNFQGIRFSGAVGKSAKQAAEHKGQYELLENWVLAIRGKAPLEITAQHGLRATRIALEVIRQCQRPASQ
jgi:predicted dehydrogenase